MPLLPSKTRILPPRVVRRVVLPSRCSRSLADSAVMCRCVLRVIAAGPKQASLSYLARECLSECLCVHVFDSALASVSRQPLLHGQQ